MDESLTEQRRVSDEGFRTVKLCCLGRKCLLQIVAGIDGTERGSHG